MMKHLLLAGAAVLGSLTLGAVASHATVIQGTGAFSDSGPSGNGLIFSGATNNTALGNGINVSLNTPFTINNFLNVSSNDTNNAFLGNATATDNVSEAFTFTLPGDGSGSVSGSGTETTASFFGFITGVSGAITWNNPGTVNFADGAVLQISLSSASFDIHGGPNQTVGVNATFDLIQGPTAVPEPGTLALLGSGLLGVGFITTRRRKSSGSACA